MKKILFASVVALAGMASVAAAYVADPPENIIVFDHAIQVDVIIDHVGIQADDLVVVAVAGLLDKHSGQFNENVKAVYGQDLTKCKKCTLLPSAIRVGDGRIITAI